MNTKSVQTVAVLSLFVLFSIVIFVSALKKPTYNWDIIPYVAAAKSWEMSDRQAIHSYVYASLKERVPQAVYAGLTAGEYRQIISADPAALQEQLPFYTVRVAYIGLIFLLGKVGVDLFVATYLISALATVAGLWLLYFAFRKTISSLYFIPFLAGAWLFHVDQIARLSTPDGLAFCVIALSAYCFMHRPRALFMFLPLSILVRTDLIVLCGLLLAAVALRHPKQRVGALVAFLVSTGVYLVLNSYGGHYGWSTLLSFTFVQITPHPATLTGAVDLPTYAGVLLEQTKKLFLEKEWLLYLGVLVGFGILFLRSRIQRREWLVGSDTVFPLVLITLLYAGIHFILFPLISSRFFIASYLIGLLGLLYLIEKKHDQREE